MRRWQRGWSAPRQKAAAREEPSRLATQADERHVHLAVDGKALRGTGAQAEGGEEAQQQVVQVYEVQTGIVLPQCPSAQDHHEVSTLKPWLTEVLCKGRMLTTDAAQSYHEFGRLVQRAGGDVILSIKGKTPATQADLELFFEEEQADRRTWRSYVQVEKGHGRLERRQIVTSPDLNDSPRSRLGRGGTGGSFATGTAHQAGAECGSSLRLDQSFASALFPKAAAAPDSRPLGLRQIGSDFRRDVTLGEDRCGVRLRPVAEMLAVLNTVVLSLMDLYRVSNVARQLRRFSAHPREALAWLVLEADF